MRGLQWRKKSKGKNQKKNQNPKTKIQSLKFISNII
jgi:hypothetical protein